MAVSRKLDKRAAVRNRIRRVIRESFRSWRADRLKDGGHALDIVVLPRAAATTTCNERLFQSLERHWSKLMSIGREQAD
jgi:ribonuclease P protein component